MKVIDQEVTYCAARNEHISLIQLVIEPVKVILYATVSENSTTLCTNLYNPSTDLTYSETIELNDNQELIDLINDDLTFNVDEVADLLDSSKIKLTVDTLLDSIG